MFGIRQCNVNEASVFLVTICQCGKWYKNLSDKTDLSDKYVSVLFFYSNMFLPIGPSFVYIIYWLSHNINIYKSVSEDDTRKNNIETHWNLNIQWNKCRCHLTSITVQSVHKCVKVTSWYLTLSCRDGLSSSYHIHRVTIQMIQT